MNEMIEKIKKKHMANLDFEDPDFVFCFSFYRCNHYIQVSNLLWERLSIHTYSQILYTLKKLQLKRMIQF